MRLSSTETVLRATLIGLVLGAVGGYGLGAILGLVLTWYNNALLEDAPHGSYAWWANFLGVFVAVFSTPVGLLLGILYGVGRVRTRSD